MIKSGGENIYPAEIERVLLADRGSHERSWCAGRTRSWGEVPVAVVARNDAALTADELLRPLPRRSSPATSSPRTIHFVAFARLAAQHHRQDPAPRGRGLVRRGGPKAPD